MLIVSWNVAGLKPALERIHSDYGRSNGSGGSGDSPLANFLRLHGGVDVLCLQEHKIPPVQLRDRSEPRRCSTVPGYESFWSCATDAGSRGLNGVVTYCRAGLVRSADSGPLRDPELDGQGRCVMTDHGSFVLFNAYVPYGGRAFQSGVPKMRFLNALRAAMGRQREAGKRVVLVGDLNLKMDKRDVHWRNLAVDVDEILRQTGEENGGDDDADRGRPKWKADIAAHWSEVERVLETLEVVPHHDRFKARVRLGETKRGDPKFAMLGNYEDSAEDVLECYSFCEKSYVDPTTDSAVVRRKRNLLSIDTLAELMRRIAKVSWDEEILREISRSSEARLNQDSPEYLWMRSVLEEDGMVDVFRHFYPTAEGRFTHWNQFHNNRYLNVGGRIDYTLVDKALLDDVERPREGATLRCGKEPHDNPLGEEAALMAATAGGLFEGGSFTDGEGIAMATKRAIDTQFGEAHCGIIYTPPSYSDHVAVSLLMRGDFGESVGRLEPGRDASTRKAQPHKAQRSISAFFGKVDSSRPSASSGDKKRTILRDVQGSRKGAKVKKSARSAKPSSSRIRSSLPKIALSSAPAPSEGDRKETGANPFEAFRYRPEGDDNR